ncbi:MAG: spore cortex biosynthesis protein YabQ [Bacillota bacterium]
MIKKELFVFLVMLSYGFILANSFHIYFILIRSRYFAKDKIFLRNLFDILFGIIGAILAFYLLLIINDGVFRLYIIIAIFTAFYIYYKIFKRGR